MPKKKSSDKAKGDPDWFLPGVSEKIQRDFARLAEIIANDPSKTIDASVDHFVFCFNLWAEHLFGIMSQGSDLQSFQDSLDKLKKSYLADALKYSKPLQNPQPFLWKVKTVLTGRVAHYLAEFISAMPAGASAPLVIRGDSQKPINEKRFPNRATWLRKQLADRRLTPLKLRKPDAKTIRRILDGLDARDSSLYTLAESLSQTGGKVYRKDIPDD